MVWLAGLVTHDVAPVVRLLQGRASQQPWRFFAAVSSASNASGMGRTRPALAVFGSSWSKARPPTSTRVAPIRRVRFSRSMSAQRCPAISPRRRPGKGEVPCVSIAVIGDAA